MIVKLSNLYTETDCAMLPLVSILWLLFLITLLFFQYLFTQVPVAKWWNDWVEAIWRRNIVQVSTWMVDHLVGGGLFFLYDAKRHDMTTISIKTLSLERTHRICLEGLLRSQHYLFEFSPQCFPSPILPTISLFECILLISVSNIQNWREEKCLVCRKKL